MILQGYLWLTAGLIGGLLGLLLWALLRARWSKRSYGTPDFTSPAHFRLVQLPVDGVIHFKSAKLIGRHLAQIEFTAEPFWPVLLRVAPAGYSLRLKNFEQNYEQTSFYWQNGVQIKACQNTGKQALFNWADNGFLYALYFPDTQMGLAGGVANDFILETYTIKS